MCEGLAIIHSINLVIFVSIEFLPVLVHKQFQQRTGTGILKSFLELLWFKEGRVEKAEKRGIESACHVG